MCAGVCGSECGVACSCEWWGAQPGSRYNNNNTSRWGWAGGAGRGALYSPRMLVPVKEASVMLSLMRSAAARMWGRLADMSVTLPVMYRVLPSCSCS